MEAFKQLLRVAELEYKRTVLEESKSVPSRLLLCIASPTLRMSPLCDLLQYLGDLNLVRFMRTCSVLYRRDYPHVALKHTYYSLLTLIAAYDQKHLIPHVERVEICVTIHTSSYPFSKTFEKVYNMPWWKKVKSLKHNGLGYNPYILDYMSTSSHLTELYTSGVCNLEEESLSSFYKSKPPLRSLTLKNQRIPRTVVQFANLESLTCLNLQHNNLEGMSIVMLSGYLETNETLTSLNLDYNSLREQGLFHLLDALKCNTTLSCLSLKGCHVNGEGAFHPLVEYMRVNKTLQVLNISDNRLTNEDLPALALEIQASRLHTFLFNDMGERLFVDVLTVAIAKNPHIRTFEMEDLSRQIRCGYSTAMCLLEISISSLTYLNMAHHEYNNNDFSIFVGVLRYNKTLRYLNLSDGHFPPESMLALASTLEGNTCLQTLNIECVNMSVEVSTAWAAMLKVNKTLLTLHMSNCGIDTRGAHLLASALDINCTLTYIDLSCNPLCEEGVLALANMLPCNRTLRQLFLSTQTGALQTLATVHALLSLNDTLIRCILSRSPFPQTVHNPEIAQLIDSRIQLVG